MSLGGRILFVGDASYSMQDMGLSRPAYSIGQAITAAMADDAHF